MYFPVRREPSIILFYVHTIEVADQFHENQL